MKSEAQRPAIEDLASRTATNLAQAASGCAFDLYRDGKFRASAGFEQISEQEQDRIFNELVVGFLVLIRLILEAPDLRVAREFRNYLGDINEKIPEAYLDQLRGLGVEENFILDWKKLIGMRYEEYARDRHGVRAAAMDLESAKRDLDLDGLAKIQMLVPVQAVAIGCHDHICRGKAEGKDELFKVTLHSLSKFYVRLRLHLEGCKITLWKRLLVGWRILLLRVRRRMRR